MQPFDFTWIFAVTVVFAFLDAYSIGANDVANSFATSVGSRSLKLWQAVAIAIFTEAGGALALGASTTETIKNKIISTSQFANHPELLMQGFMSALISSSSWVMFATYMGWPVSTTHSIVGAVAGVGISSFGVNTVDWSWNGMGKIIASWFISPVFAGIIASAIFLITKFTIMSSKNSLVRGIYAIPIYFGLTLGIMAFYIILKNGRAKIVSVSVDYTTGAYSTSGDWGFTMGILAAVIGGVVIICYLTIVPYFKRLLIDEEDLKWYHIPVAMFLPKQPKNPKISDTLKQQFTPDQIDSEETEFNSVSTSEDIKKDIEAPAAADSSLIDAEKVASPATGVVGFIKARFQKSLFMDIASTQALNKDAIEANAVAIRYDNKTEYLYSFLQVCTAAFASFAHGSNDVANAVGPLAATYQIWSTAKFAANTAVPYWTLVYGAVALDLGLALYGYNIMKSLGNNLTYQSPSRGFSMELGAALTVITASFLGLPVSTTHCITGATVGVGLCNGSFNSINWKMVAWCLFSWILTVPVAGTAAGLIFALMTRGASFSYGV